MLGAKLFHANPGEIDLKSILSTQYWSRLDGHKSRPLTRATAPRVLCCLGVQRVGVPSPPLPASTVFLLLLSDYVSPAASPLLLGHSGPPITDLKILANHLSSNVGPGRLKSLASCNAARVEGFMMCGLIGCSLGLSRQHSMLD